MDAAGTGEAVTAAGGQVLMAPMEVGPFGTMAICTDPTGAVFGLWQSGSHTGYDRTLDPGSVVWNDAMVGDLETAKAFYRRVFGYHYVDMDGSDGSSCTISLSEGGRPVASIGVAPDGAPPCWSTHLAVADLDAAIDRVAQGGGADLLPPSDYAFGRMAMVTGPDGEAFGMVQRAADG